MLIRSPQQHTIASGTTYCKGLEQFCHTKTLFNHVQAGQHRHPSQPTHDARPHTSVLKQPPAFVSNLVHLMPHRPLWPAPQWWKKQTSSAFPNFCWLRSRVKTHFFTRACSQFKIIAKYTLTSTHIYICIFTYLFIYLFIFIYSYIYMSIHLSIYLNTTLSVCLSVYLPIYLSICLFEEKHTCAYLLHMTKRIVHISRNDQTFKKSNFRFVAAKQP